MVNSKQKGASFERDVCQALSMWVSGDKRKDLFWRSAMSGGRSTVGRKKGVDLNYQAGDICAVHPQGHVLTDKLYFECKHLKKFTLDHLLLDTTGPQTINGIWEDTCISAANYKRIPVLIARQNRWPTLLITNYEGINFLALHDFIRVEANWNRAMNIMDICLFTEIMQKVLPPE